MASANQYCWRFHSTALSVPVTFHSTTLSVPPHIPQHCSVSPPSQCKFSRSYRFSGKRRGNYCILSYYMAFISTGQFQWNFLYRYPHLPKEQRKLISISDLHGCMNEHIRWLEYWWQNTHHVCIVLKVQYFFLILYILFEIATILLNEMWTLYKHSALT